MRKSLAALLVIGVTGIVAVLGMLYYVMAQFSAAGRFAKIATQIKETYHLEEVFFTVVQQDGQKVLNINYTTRNDSGYDLSVCTQEMTAIFQMTLIQYKAQTKMDPPWDSIKITRTELRGSGCFQKPFLHSIEVGNPYKIKPPDRGY